MLKTQDLPQGAPGRTKLGNVYVWLASPKDFFPPPQTPVKYLENT